MLPFTQNPAAFCRENLKASLHLWKAMLSWIPLHIVIARILKSSFHLRKAIQSCGSARRSPKSSPPSTSWAFAVRLFTLNVHFSSISVRIPSIFVHHWAIFVHRLAMSFISVSSSSLPSSSPSSSQPLSQSEPCSLPIHLSLSTLLRYLAGTRVHHSMHRWFAGDTQVILRRLVAVGTSDAEATGVRCVICPSQVTPQPSERVEKLQSCSNAGCSVLSPAARMLPHPCPKLPRAIYKFKTKINWLKKKWIFFDRHILKPGTSLTVLFTHTLIPLHSLYICFDFNLLFSLFEMICIYRSPHQKVFLIQYLYNK